MATIRGRWVGVAGVVEGSECRPESLAPFESVSRKGSML